MKNSVLGEDMLTSKELLVLLPPEDFYWNLGFLLSPFCPFFFRPSTRFSLIGGFLTALEGSCLGIMYRPLFEF